MVIEEKLRSKYVNFLRSLKIFNGWTFKKVEKLLHAIEKRKVEKNQYIITEGVKAGKLFHILYAEFR